MLKTALLVLSLAAVVSALITLIPEPGMIKNDLGYFSLCPFAPWSTLALLLAAGLIWLVRGYISTRVD